MSKIYIISNRNKCQWRKNQEQEEVEFAITNTVVKRSLIEKMVFELHKEGNPIPH